MSIRHLSCALLALSACASSQSARPSGAAAPQAAAVAPSTPAEREASARQKAVEDAIERKDWDAALAGAQALTREEPDNAAAWRYLGLAHANQGHMEQAIAPFQRSVELQDAARTRGNLGFALAASGRVDEALPHFQRAVALAPDYGNAWLYLGKALLQLGRREEALSALERAEQLVPNNPEVRQLLAAAQPSPAGPPQAALEHHARGGVLAMQGRLEEAEREYREALAIAPGFADCHYNLGQLASRRGDLETAEREYRAAIAGYAPSESHLRADAQNNLADLLTRRGAGGTEAVQLVRDAISVRGERASYLDTLARACDAAGERPCAVEAFRKLLGSGASLPADVRLHAQKRLQALESK